MIDRNNVEISPNNFTVTTWNVNGVKDRVKQQTVLQHLKKLSSDIVFLQELHLKPGEIKWLKKQWVGEAYESNYTSKSRGVGILISKNLPFTLISKQTDTEGRFLILNCEIFGEKYTLVNTYSPPLSNMKYLRNIQNLLQGMSIGIIIFGGDLNQVFTTQDSSNIKRRPNVPKVLLNFISTNELIDVWRLKYPRHKDYTFYSHAQDSHSRLDYIFISKTAIGDIIGPKIHNIIISDHAPVTCTLCPPKNKMVHRIWRMNRKHLMDEEFVNHIRTHIKEFIITNFDHSDSDKPAVHVIWDAFKAYIRGVVIGITSRKKRELDKHMKDLEIFINQAEHIHKTTHGKKDLEVLQKLKLEYDHLLLEKAKNIL